MIAGDESAPPSLAPPSQRGPGDGEAGGSPPPKEPAGGLLQADRARRAGDEHGCGGLHALHEGRRSLKAPELNNEEDNRLCLSGIKWDKASRIFAFCLDVSIVIFRNLKMKSVLYCLV